MTPMDGATVWTAIVVVVVISFAIKAAGPALLGGRALPPRARAVIALLAPVLLAALVVVNVAGPDWATFDWTVPVGLAVVVAAHARRAPTMVAIVLGASVTALLRLWT